MQKPTSQTLPGQSARPITLSLSADKRLHQAGVHTFPPHPDPVAGETCEDRRSGVRVALVNWDSSFRWCHIQIAGPPPDGSELHRSGRGDLRDTDKLPFGDVHAVCLFRWADRRRSGWHRLASAHVWDRDHHESHQRKNPLFKEGGTHLLFPSPDAQGKNYSCMKNETTCIFGRKIGYWFYLRNTSYMNKQKLT